MFKPTKSKSAAKINSRVNRQHEAFLPNAGKHESNGSSKTTNQSVIAFQEKHQRNAKELLPDSLAREITSVLDQNISKRSSRMPGRKNNPASFKTQQERRHVLLQAFGQLWASGYRIHHLKNFSDKHVRVLTDYWLSEKLSASVLTTRLSMLRVFCEWIGKKGMIRQTAEYFPNGEASRTTIATTNKSWECNGVDPESVINQSKQLDLTLSAMLGLQHHLGLRVKESIEFRPLHSQLDNSGLAIMIHEGTKGGRPRVIQLDTEAKRKAFEVAKQIVSRTKRGRLRWEGMTYKQAKRYYYYLVAEKLHINKRDKGVTSHGLRHGFSQDSYSSKSGRLPPIQGGRPEDISQEEHYMTSLQVAGELGHGRVDVVATYYGSFGHSLRHSNNIQSPPDISDFTQPLEVKDE